MIEWFQSPTFPLPYVVGVIFLVWLYFKLNRAFREARLDKERTLWENEQRSRLTPEDYKTDKWQGSFNHEVTAISADGQPCASNPVPKPPDAVKPWWQRFKENF